VPFGKPEKLKFPNASAVAVEFVCPDSVTTVPVPLAAGEIFPEIENVGTIVVKLTPVTFALLTTTLWLGGVKVKPVWEGTTE